MRISDRMLNDTARRAGIPINNASLLNNVSDTESENTLLGALSRKDKTSDPVSKTSYEKLEKNANEYQKSAEELLAEGEDSIFAAARASGDHQAVHDKVADLLKSYNQLLKSLKNSSNSLNDYYKQMLNEAAGENKAAFSALGITISKDGALDLDKDVLKQSRLDDLEKVFGSAGLFTSKTAFIASRAADHARANVDSFTNSYNSKGASYSAASSSSWYDLFG